MIIKESDPKLNEDYQQANQAKSTDALHGNQQSYNTINPAKEETFQIDVYNMAVNINSIVLRISDGVIENYIGQQQTAPTPLIELVINELQYDTR